MPIILSQLKWQDMIRVDVPENIPGENPILESRRRRLDELAQEEERKYRKSLEPQESPVSKSIWYTHYIYSAYELLKYLLN